MTSIANIFILGELKRGKHNRFEHRTHIEEAPIQSVHATVHKGTGEGGGVDVQHTATRPEVLFGMHNCPHHEVEEGVEAQRAC